MAGRNCHFVEGSRGKIGAFVLFLSFLLHAAAGAEELKLQNSCVIPPPQRFLTGLSLDAQLWEFDPFLADAPATERDWVTIHNISLNPGRAKTIPLTLKAEGY